jgi:hypothetical protein
MRIRLTGTQAECQDLLAVLPELLAEVADIRQLTAWTPVYPGPQRQMTEPNRAGLDTAADHDAACRSDELRGRIHLRLRPTRQIRTQRGNDATTEQGASR